MVEAVERDEMRDERRGTPVDTRIDAALDLNAAVIVALGCNDKGAWSSCREALEAALARFRTEGIDITARSIAWQA